MELSPISHSNHAAFLASTQAGLKKTQDGSAKGKTVATTPLSERKRRRKKKGRRTPSATKIPVDVEELNDSAAWDSPTRNVGSSSGRRRGKEIAKTPQPQRVAAKQSKVRQPPRPSSAGPKRRPYSKQNGGTGKKSRNTRTKGVPATRAQIQKLKQRLMRTIVANRLFSVNELNFVFENAIELSPFDREDMHQMIFELKEELGLSRTLDGNDWVDDDEDLTQNQDATGMKTRYRATTERPPGSKTYHHDLA